MIVMSASVTQRVIDWYKVDMRRGRLSRAKTLTAIARVAEHCSHIFYDGKSAFKNGVCTACGIHRSY